MYNYSNSAIITSSKNFWKPFNVKTSNIYISPHPVFFFFLFWTYFVLGYSQLTSLWQFQVNSKGTPPYMYMYPFSPKPPVVLSFSFQKLRSDEVFACGQAWARSHAVQGGCGAGRHGDRDTPGRMVRQRSQWTGRQATSSQGFGPAQVTEPVTGQSQPSGLKGFFLFWFWLLELDNSFFFLINLIVNWLCKGTSPTPKCLSWYVNYFKLKTTKAPKNLQEASLSVSLTAYKNSSASSWNSGITTASASRVGWRDGEAQQDPWIWVHCVPRSLPGPWNIYQNICFSLPM